MQETVFRKKSAAERQCVHPPQEKKQHIVKRLAKEVGLDFVTIRTVNSDSTEPKQLNRLAT